MASNVSTVDGMGFEEVNQSTSTEIVSGTNVYGTNISGVAMRITQDLSVGDAIDCTTIQERDRQLFSTSIQNATELFGYKVKAGSVLMDAAGYSGLISFVDLGSFSTANYFMTISARNWTLPTANSTGSITNFGISGIRRASGCWAFGPSGTVADWIAIGI